MPRALRRAHKARMIEKARKLYGKYYHPKLVNNRTACSCMMCGNPRKWFGERSIQERRCVEAKDDEGYPSPKAL